jgi:hypothetical protein
MDRFVFGKDVHTFLAEKAKEKLEKLGYKVVPEFELIDNGKKKRVDLLAQKEAENIAIEVLTTPNSQLVRKKIQDYSKFFTKIVFVIPENSSILPIDNPSIDVWKFDVPKELMKDKKLIISLTDQQFEELKKMVKAGIYRTRTEAVRDAVRKLIEEKRKASLISNGGEHEYF